MRRRTFAGFLSLVPAAAVAAVGLLAGCGGGDPPAPPPKIEIGEQESMLWGDIGITDYRLAAAQRRYDVRHYRLDVSVDPAACAIRARARIRGTKESGLGVLLLDFYAGPYRIESVTSAGRALVSQPRPSHRLAVTLPDAAATTFEVTIAYRGKPPVVESDSGWSCGLLFTEVGGHPVVNTCFQPFFARSVFPCKDHPSDKAEDGVDLRITVPRGLRVVATGSRVSAEETLRHRTEHWRTRYAVATNLISFAAAPFVELASDHRTVEGKTLALRHYVLPGYEQQARAAFAEVPRVLGIFERAFGPFPFPDDKFSLVQTSYSGLENQTAIAYGTSFPAQPPGRGEYDYTLVHEAAHEWAGNAITCRDWRDIWLHEGIATYAEGLYLEARDGRDVYLDLAHAWQSRAADEALTARDIHSDDDIFKESAVYARAPAVLHMLRFVIGDDAFLGGLKAFLSDPALRGRNADTAAFRRAMEKAAGRDLGDFFRAWVDGEGFFDLAYDVVERGAQIVVAVRAVSGGANRHRLPIVVRLVTGAEPVDRRITVGPDGTVVRFRRPTDAWKVVFDPEGWLLTGDTDRRPGLLRELGR